MTEVYDLIGGRATWTALGLPTEGVVGDQRRISSVVTRPSTVGVDSVVGDITGDGPVAVLGPGGVLVGGLDASTARGLPADTPVRRAMVPAPGTIRPELRIEEVAQQLADDGLDHVFVTTVSGVLLGMATAHGSIEEDAHG